LPEQLRYATQWGRSPQDNGIDSTLEPIRMPWSVNMTTHQLGVRAGHSTSSRAETTTPHDDQRSANLRGSAHRPGLLNGINCSSPSNHDYKKSAAALDNSTSDNLRRRSGLKAAAALHPKIGPATATVPLV
jgi:hypothetical protein